MGKEIERKFLVRNLPGNLGVFQSEEILQGYIPHTDTIEERLRLKGNRYFHTFKSKDKKTGKNLTLKLVRMNLKNFGL
ncbi:MAG: hypothetical protein AABX26_02880 [Nanoarchaeota archaeon]